MCSDMVARESRLRSILKAISYRISGTITTVALAWFVTGEVSTALAIGSIEPVAKMVIYYFHERVWQQVPIGTVRALVKGPFIRPYRSPRRWR